MAIFVGMLIYQWFGTKVANYVCVLGRRQYQTPLNPSL